MKEQASSNRIKNQNLGHLMFAWGLLAGQGNSAGVRFKELLPGFTDANPTHFWLKSDREKDSLQTRLIGASGSGVKAAQVWHKFEQAEASGKIALANMLLGPSFVERLVAPLSTEWIEAAFWRFVALAGENALQAVIFQRTISDKAREQDTAFFVELGRVLAASKEMEDRSKQFPEINKFAFKMAEYWVHPDAPLWLMNNEAGSRYVGHLLGLDFSAEYFAQLIVRYRLKRLGRYPIRDVRISKEGVFNGFEYSKWAKVKV